MTVGASAVCVDTRGCLYAATQMGIQTTSHAGHANTILPLPGNLPVTGVAFGGDDHSILYAESNGRIFKRKVLTRGLTETTAITEPTSPLF